MRGQFRRFALDGAARRHEPGDGVNEEIGAFQVAVRKAAVVEDGEEAGGLVDQAVEDDPAFRGAEAVQAGDVAGQFHGVGRLFGQQIALAEKAEMRAVPYGQRPGRRQAAQAQAVPHDVGAQGGRRPEQRRPGVRPARDGEALVDHPPGNAADRKVKLNHRG